MRGLIFLAALALAACDLTPTEPGSEPASKSPATRAGTGLFAHSQTEDLSGYYIPAAPVGPDDFRLVNLFVGQNAAFDDWERGERSATLSPVLLEFRTAGGRTERVLADRYDISDSRIQMSGISQAHGRVAFDGRLDQGALSTARRNLGEGDAPALTAAVTIDGRTVGGVKFAWSGGD